jgi:hypothetical protein
LLKKTEFGVDGSALVTEYQRDASGRLLVKRNIIKNFTTPLKTVTASGMTQS